MDVQCSGCEAGGENCPGEWALGEPSCRLYVLVQGEQVAWMIDGFDLLQPRVVGSIGATHAALALPFHDVHVVAVFLHGQFRFPCLSPLTCRSLSVVRVPVGENVEGNATPSQRKGCCRNRHSRHCAVEMNEEAFDGERRARKCMCENL